VQDELPLSKTLKDKVCEFRPFCLLFHLICELERIQADKLLGLNVGVEPKRFRIYYDRRGSFHLYADFLCSLFC